MQRARSTYLGGLQALPVTKAASARLASKASELAAAAIVAVA